MNNEKMIDNPMGLLRPLYQKLRTSLFVKLLFVGAILLVCQIPMLMIQGLTEHRQGLAGSVEREVAAKWGYEQKLVGPLLAIPLTQERSEKNKDGSVRNYTEHSLLFVVPDTLKVSATMTPLVRYRGIYEVMLYRSQVVVEGVFSEKLPIPEEWTAALDKAKLYLGLSDMVGLSDLQVEVDCSENKVQPGIDTSAAPFSSGISIPVALPAEATLPADGLRFKATFALNGCRNLSAVPIAKNTEIDLDSTWSNPSFDGDFLPVERNVGPDGFHASWKINEFNRNLPPSWMDYRDGRDLPLAGVNLLKPANVYAQVLRAVTYSILIFLIVLMAFLIAEQLTKTWMHPLQYFLAALSLVLFYALTLALSEHLAFSLSYWLAAFAITGLCVFYCAMIFRKKTAVAVLGAAVLLAYAVIFVLLRLEDYALLAGTLVMLALLAILMAMTGRINRLDEKHSSN